MLNIVILFFPFRCDTSPVPALTLGVIGYRAEPLVQFPCRANGCQFFLFGELPSSIWKGVSTGRLQPAKVFNDHKEICLQLKKGRLKIGLPDAIRPYLTRRLIQAERSARNERRSVRLTR